MWGCLAGQLCAPGSPLALVAWSSLRGVRCGGEVAGREEKRRMERCHGSVKGVGVSGRAEDRHWQYRGWGVSYLGELCLYPATRQHTCILPLYAYVGDILCPTSCLDGGWVGGGSWTWCGFGAVFFRCPCSTVVRRFIGKWGYTGSLLLHCIELLK